jgi:hypothetical protein
MSKRLAALLIAFATIGGSFGLAMPPRVRVTNSSAATLTGVALEGRGFREHLPDLKPGASHCAIVSPSGESGLRLTFTTLARQVTAGDLAYIEPKGGYRVHLLVGPDLVPAPKTRLSLLPWCGA